MALLTEDWKRDLCYQAAINHYKLPYHIIRSYQEKDSEWILASLNYVVAKQDLLYTIVDFFDVYSDVIRNRAIDFLDYVVQNNSVDNLDRLVYLCLISMLQYDYEIRQTHLDLVENEKQMIKFLNTPSFQPFLSQYIEEWRAGQYLVWTDTAPLGLHFFNLENVLDAIMAARTNMNVLFVNQEQADRVMCLLENRFVNTKRAEN